MNGVKYLVFKKNKNFTAGVWVGIVKMRRIWAKIEIWPYGWNTGFELDLRSFWKNHEIGGF